MKMKFAFTLCLLTLSFSNLIIAQNIIYSSEEGDNINFEHTPVLKSENTDSENKENRINFNLDMGTSFSTSNIGNAMRVYTAPQLNYKFSPKINIKAGFLVSNTTVYDYYRSDKTNRNNFTNSYVFAGVDYYASERLRISGEILYGTNNSPYSYSNFSSKTEYALRFSAEYKITKSISVGIQVINQNGRNPYGYNPFYRNPFDNYYNPYDPFHR